MSDLLKLARPVPAKYVSKAPSGHGLYVSHDIINQILLGIVGPFSFQVEQIVYNPDGLVDGCTASLSVTVDGRPVTITEAGDCDFPEQKKTQGDRLKNAASDALKRCAMRLGLGLHLWADPDYFLFDGLSKRESGPVTDSGQLIGSVTSTTPNAGYDAPLTPRVKTDA